MKIMCLQARELENTLISEYVKSNDCLLTPVLQLLILRIAGTGQLQTFKALIKLMQFNHCQTERL